jgi:hypothetical protein
VLRIHLAALAANPAGIKVYKSIHYATASISWVVTSFAGKIPAENGDFFRLSGTRFDDFRFVNRPGRPNSSSLQNSPGNPLTFP